MRWWLALAFGLIAAATALGVWLIVSARAESAFREHAEELALGNATASAVAVSRAVRRGDLADALPVIAERREAALFVFDEDGALLTPERIHRTDLAAVPFRVEALVEALAGQPFVEQTDDGRSTVVGLPLRQPERGALIAYVPRPELAAGLGIAREKIAQTSLWAAVIGAFAGFAVAAVITARLRRIAAAAAEIERGNFNAALRPDFGDELGDLAETVDRMRVRLRESFYVLGAERDRLHLLLERLPEGVLEVDRDLLVEYANAAARRILALPDDARELPLPEPWPGHSLRALADALFDDDAEVVEQRVAAGGATYGVAGIPAGTGHAAVIVIADVSERERRERAQRDFVANAAHELRTPLSVISGAVEMLEAGAKDDADERDRFLAHIRSEASRLGRLARALLALARAETRAEPLRVEPLALRPILEQAAATLRLPDGVDAEVACPPDLRVLAQPDLLAQIVANLADNAAKHTTAGRVLLSASASGADVAIEVADTGAGIPRTEQEAVFDRFYRATDRRDAEGFGLGLAIVRQAVHALGGRIELESDVGRGTTVRVLLPRAVAAPRYEEVT
jgi:signal transduction histidine kinase